MTKNSTTTSPPSATSNSTTERELAKFVLTHLVPQLKIIEDPNHEVSTLTKNLILAMQGKPYELPVQFSPEVKTYADKLTDAMPDPTWFEQLIATTSQLMRLKCEWDMIEIGGATLMGIERKLGPVVKVIRKMHP